MKCGFCSEDVKKRVRNVITKIWKESSSYEDFKREVFYWLEK